jgi:hypothetical protein
MIAAGIKFQALLCSIVHSTHPIPAATVHTHCDMKHINKTHQDVVDLETSPPPRAGQLSTIHSVESAGREGLRAPFLGPAASIGVPGSVHAAGALLFRSVPGFGRDVEAKTKRDGQIVIVSSRQQPSTTQHNVVFFLMHKQKQEAKTHPYSPKVAGSRIAFPPMGSRPPIPSQSWMQLRDSRAGKAGMTLGLSSATLSCRGRGCGDVHNFGTLSAWMAGRMDG